MLSHEIETYPDIQCFDEVWSEFNTWVESRIMLYWMNCDLDDLGKWAIANIQLSILNH